MKVLFVYFGYENLGLESLSAVLKAAGHETALAFDPLLFDDHYSQVPFLARRFDASRRVLEAAVAERPDLVAFSVVTDDWLRISEMARRLKERLTVPFVFGGIHATSVPERVVAKDFVDYLIVGEGEHALLDLVDALGKGGAVDGIANLWWKSGGEVRRNPPRPLISDLDTLPLADKSLFYKDLPWLATDWMTITSRGCPHDCSYCFNNPLRKLYAGKGPYLRRRSVGNVLAELVAARSNWPVQRIQFVDDVFTSSLPWLEDFARGYIRDIHLPFWCSVHPSFVSADIVALLREMGCWEVQMGVQTTATHLRVDVLRRRESLAEVASAIDQFKAAGIKCVVDHMSGLPGETEAMFAEAMSFYSHTRPSRISDYRLRYYPRTDIVKMALDAGILDEATVSDIEEGAASTSFALGGTRTVHSPPEEMLFLLAILLLLPERLDSLLLSRKLYRYLPRRSTAVKMALRTHAALRNDDVNARRYWLKYLHFLKKALA